MIKTKVTQEVQIPLLVFQVVTKSDSFSVKEGKTVVISSCLALLIFLLGLYLGRFAVLKGIIISLKCFQCYFSVFVLVSW